MRLHWGRPLSRKLRQHNVLIFGLLALSCVCSANFVSCATLTNNVINGSDGHAYIMTTNIVPRHSGTSPPPIISLIEKDGKMYTKKSVVRNDPEKEYTLWTVADHNTNKIWSAKIPVNSTGHKIVICDVRQIATNSYYILYTRYFKIVNDEVLLDASNLSFKIKSSSVLCEHYPVMIGGVKEASIESSNTIKVITQDGNSIIQFKLSKGQWRKE